MISVVIPARNAAATLGAQLSALAIQAHGATWEVIVADNGSTDDTAEVASAFANRIPVRVVDASRRRGPSAARNIGVTHAVGDLLLFCDADDVVLRGWVPALAQATGPGRCTTGPYFVTSRTDIDPGDFDTWMPLRRSVPMYLGQIPMLQSNNLAIAREDFESVGGFDEELRCAEDAELGIRLVEHGCELAWCPDARVVSRSRATSLAQFRQFLAYGRWDVRVYRKHRGKALHRPPLRDALRDYGSLVVHLPRLVDRGRRRSWLVTAGQRTGRLVGSFRERTLCL